jgi:uncharacterized phage protein (TIGR01671 family)
MDANRFRFRVWDKKKGIMRLWDWLCRQEFPFLIEPADNICGVFRDENYILMQSTGLCDREGKEIFEGDIVKHSVWDSYGLGLPYDSFERDCLSEVYWNKEEGQWFTRTRAVVEVDEALVDCYKTEIIGNIYEHPSLLEPAGKEG